MSKYDFIDKESLLIIDLEATCWDKGSNMNHEMEIIEIGAVLVNARSMDSSREFQSFARPTLNPHLREFCKELTSISQNDVDGAPIFPIVLENLIRFVGDISETTMASWGKYDRNQLLQDCLRHGIPYPFGENHLNIKELFSSEMKVNKCGMKMALKILGLALDGTHHRGLDDARNIFRILQHITKN